MKEQLPSVFWMGATCKKLTDEVLAWLCVWSKLQMICIWSSWCHPIVSCLIKTQTDWFNLSGASLSRLSRKRGH